MQNRLNALYINFNGVAQHGSQYLLKLTLWRIFGVYNKANLMAIAIEKEVRPDSRPPTSLNLLHFRTPALDGTRINNFRENLDTAAAFETQCQRTGSFLIKLSSEAKKRHDRITNSEQELLKVIPALVSSQQFADVYLRMREAFQQMDFQDFIAAFKKSLELTLSVSELFGWKGADKDSKKLFLGRTPSSRINNQASVLVRKYLENTPDGFTQGPSEWKNFLGHPDNFISGIPSSKVKSVTQKGSIRAVTRFIMSTGIPDWFSYDMKDEPDKAKIQEEMEDDRQAQENIEKQLEASNQQKLLNINATVKRANETIQWANSKNKELFDNLNMAKLLLFLHFIDSSQNQIRESLNTIRKAFTDQQEYLPENTDRQVENTVKKYSESEAILRDPENYALFLEEKFMDAGINPSLALIDDAFINFIRMITVSDKNHIKKSLSKKSANAINYGIKPLMDILNPEDIDMTDFAKDYAGQSVEYFIWELSDLIAAKFQSQSGVDWDNHSIKSALIEVREFSAAFLRKNWQWAYDNLKLELTEIDKGRSIISTMPQNTTMSPDSRNNQNQNGKPSAESINNAIFESQEGNLSDWKLYYSDNRSTDIKHLTEIGGNTLEEKEKTLEVFLARSQIPVSIKSSSIINTFDWLVTVPKDVEEVRMKKNVNGEIFKKIKRGPVRIFYVMDEARKQIIFFLHQKQAMGYGF
ncbi:MAG: hypothetical protein HY425_02215 [Candidatus Levybacteria bacterium]|nr:hypothetical protein [Candidatus Levybacteria bacterium]